MRQLAIHIMASKRSGTFYTGVTSDLSRRAYEHRESCVEGFTRRHGCNMLVYCERYDDMPSALAREKQIKGSCSEKLAPIESLNPTRRDLYEDLA